MKNEKGVNMKKEILFRVVLLLMVSLVVDSEISINEKAKKMLKLLKCLLWYCRNLMESGC